MNGAVSKTVVGATPPRVRIPLSPPLSCSEPEMRLPLGAFFLLFQRRLADAAELRRLTPGSISVSEQPSVSNRANLAPSGSVNESTVFSIVWLMALPDGFPALSSVGGPRETARGGHSAVFRCERLGKPTHPQWRVGLAVPTVPISCRRARVQSRTTRLALSD